MTLEIHADTVPLRASPEGVIYVGKTQVPLETVIRVFNRGVSPEEIAFQYPALALPDIYLVIGYYLHHREEVDQYVQQAAIHAEQVRQENEARFDATGIRERLLARSQHQD
jgi:uncharacterized protein (DUF433 family)